MKCTSCGAALVYDIESGQMHCSYCGQYSAVEEVRSEYAGDTMEQNVYACTSCGARVMVSNVESVTFCIYCGQPTVIMGRMRDLKRPKRIIPFSVTKEQACKTIRKRLKRGAYIPKEMKRFNPDMVRGIYLPFRRYDVDFRAQYLVKHFRSPFWISLYGILGSMVPTMHYSDATAVFRNLTADTSAAFNDTSAHRLEPYDLSRLKPFYEGYMLGFYGDCSDEGTTGTDQKIIDRCRELYEADLFGKLKGKNEVVDSARKVSILDAEDILLPVWFLTFHENGLHYTMMVNGQTGKCVGAVPVNQKKSMITTTILTLLFCSVPIWLILWMYLSRGPLGYYYLDEYIGMVSGVFCFYSFMLLFFTYPIRRRKTEKLEKSLELAQESAIRHLAQDRQGKKK